jgi:hypothetical protein
MPNIREVNAGNIGLQPTEIGVEATAGAARRIGAFYNQAGNALAETGQRAGGAIRDAGDAAVKFEDHREISAGIKNGTDLMANLTNMWNQTIKAPGLDPNDPSVAAKFKAETLEPALQQFQSGFNTEASQTWAQHFVGQYRQHMSEKTSADMSKLAGDAVQTNITQTINRLGSMARSDPSSLDFAMKTIDESIGAIVASSPTLSPTDAAKARTEVSQKAKEGIVKSAVMGMIEKNPGIDLGAIEKKYSDYINGPELAMFAKAAKTQARSDFLQQKQIEAYQRQQGEQAVHVASNKNFSDNVTIDPSTNRPIIKPEFFTQALDIAKKYPDAPNSGTVAKTLLDWGEHQQNLKDSAIRSDPTVKQDFVDRMFTTDNPTSEIELMRAQVKGQLSKDDFTSMHQMVKTLQESPLKGPVWKDTMDAVKSDLIVSVPGIPGKDTVGTNNYAKFAQSFIPQYLVASRAGTLQPNALDIKDPESMISKAMAPFRRTQSQRMSDYISAAGGLTVGGGSQEPTKPSTEAARPKSKAERDALPRGTKYVAPDGSVRTRE